MNRKLLFVVLAAGLVGALCTASAARMISGGGEVIVRHVVATGGSEIADGQAHFLSGTVGQPVAAVSKAGNGTMLVGGYQTMVPRPPSTGARLWRLY